MKYETLENVLMKELRLLRKTLMIVLAAFSLITLVVLVSKNKFFLQGGSVVKTKYQRYCITPFNFPKRYSC
jgi:hypothetical protein